MKKFVEKNTKETSENPKTKEIIEIKLLLNYINQPNNFSWNQNSLERKNPMKSTGKIPPLQL